MDYILSIGWLIIVYVQRRVIIQIDNDVVTGILHAAVARDGKAATAAAFLGVTQQRHHRITIGHVRECDFACLTTVSCHNRTPHNNYSSLSLHYRKTIDNTTASLTIRVVGARRGCTLLGTATRRRHALTLRQSQAQLLRHFRVVLVVHVVEDAAACHLHLWKNKNC